MKDKEVLQKAIEITGLNMTVCDRIHYPTIKTTIGEFGTITEVDYEKVIFSHDFAKAFWGEKIIETDNWSKQEWDCCATQDQVPAWQYRLQQMVLEENPINYLRKFINTEKSKS